MNVNADTRIERFANVYATCLADEIRKHPADYCYPIADAAVVALKMTLALAKGTASLGPASKRAARTLGVHPTQRDIRAWLQGGMERQEAREA